VPRTFVVVRHPHTLVILRSGATKDLLLGEEGARFIRKVKKGWGSSPPEPALSEVECGSE